MCRNIRTLGHFEPPATRAEIAAASLQFVRKVSGMRKPSQDNTAAFDAAVDDVTEVVEKLLESLNYRGAPKNRDVEAAKHRARSAARFGQ